MTIPRSIVNLPQMQQNLSNRMPKFLLHFLMMTPALIGLPRANKSCHWFKDFVEPPQMFIQKMMTMYLHKPVITPILPLLPMTKVLICRRFTFWERFGIWCYFSVGFLFFRGFGRGRMRRRRERCYFLFFKTFLEIVRGD